MITHLSGKLIEKAPTHLVIECAGVGYLVKISLHTFSKLGTDEHLRIYTQLQVREDAHTLYGFHTVKEREMFNHLITISGIGTNTAILMLSALTPEDIATAIVGGDSALIQSIKGIGAKTAQRVIIELKDKVTKPNSDTGDTGFINNTNQKDALTALLALGFDKRSAEKAIGKVIRDDQTVEAMVKEALKVL